jgi:hypothetical protein
MPFVSPFLREFRVVRVVVIRHEKNSTLRILLADLFERLNNHLLD